MPYLLIRSYEGARKNMEMMTYLSNSREYFYYDIPQEISIHLIEQSEGYLISISSRLQKHPITDILRPRLEPFQ